MSRIDKSRDLWKRKPLEPAKKPKEEVWQRAKAASPGRSLSREEIARVMAERNTRS